MVVVPVGQRHLIRKSSADVARGVRVPSRRGVEEPGVGVVQVASHVY